MKLHRTTDLLKSSRALRVLRVRTVMRVLRVWDRAEGEPERDAQVDTQADARAAGEAPVAAPDAAAAPASDAPATTKAPAARPHGRPKAGLVARIIRAVTDVVLFVPRRVLRALLFFPRLVVGAKRYTLPRRFGQRRVLQEEDFDSQIVIHGHNPVQRLLEHLRVGYLNVLEALDGAGSVALMSPKGREGRSMIAANMAIAMAHDTGRDVLLLDLDMRNPSLHTLLGVDEGPGFSDLRPGDDPSELIVDTGRPNLRLIRAGLDLADPVRTLNRGVLPELLERLRRDGHFVIVDCPEANAFTDCQLISEHVSGVATVVQLGSTKRGSLAAYYRRLDGARFLGVIANFHELWIPPWLYRFL